MVKRLAAGGMADVLLARTDGIEGFQRHVVIKRIHADLLDEQRYVTMFLDEARLAASLHHHNIVQVNDIGVEGGEYFFAMEYVHGEDVRTLLIDASKRGEQIPLEHVITIVMAAAAGLHHAHEQRGMDGTPLHIVHRDVSPANILVGYDGAVKVADFGIALAAHRAEHTQSGVLKGKVAYMSPEQCNCEPVDRRSDVFSLGIVLYELVTVRPCFAGDNDYMTMSAIVGGKVERPSVFRKDLPAALEAIIMKALAPAPADRYQTADELRLALEELAATSRLRTSTTALADYMKAKFGEKALPWQEEDDDEPEIEVGQGSVDELPRRHASSGRVLTPAPNGVLVATARQRTPAPTVPLRPPAVAADDLALPVDDDLSIPVDNTPAPRAPTMPLRALSLRPPGHAVVGTARPSNDEVAARVPAVRVVTEAEPAEPVIEQAAASAPRSRRIWLVGSIAAVVIAAVSLIVVSTGRGKPVSRASAAPAKVTEEREPSAAPQPLERPRVVRPAVVAPAAAKGTADQAMRADSKRAPAARDHDDEPVPAAKRRRPAAKKPAPTKKWDPDALFPQ